MGHDREAKTVTKQNQNRWFTSAILFMALLAFVGLAVLPFLGGLRQASTPAASPRAGSPTSEREQLAAEIKGYELVLKREPDNQSVLRGLLEARLKMGDRKGAIQPLAKLAELNPDEPDYSILLAQAQTEAGELEAAATTYRRTIDRQPSNLKALQGLATLLVQQQRPQAAVGLIQEALDRAIAANKQKPNSADVVSVRMLLGDVYVKLERYEDAIAAFDKALEGNPKDFRPVLAKALVLKTQGKTTQAEALFATAAGLAPDRFKDEIRKLATAEPSPQATATPSPGASPSDSAEPGPVTPPPAP